MEQDVVGYIMIVWFQLIALEGCLPTLHLTGTRTIWVLNDIKLFRYGVVSCNLHQIQLRTTGDCSATVCNRSFHSWNIFLIYRPVILKFSLLSTLFIYSSIRIFNKRTRVIYNLLKECGTCTNICITMNYKMIFVFQVTFFACFTQPIFKWAVFPASDLKC